MNNRPFPTITDHYRSQLYITDFPDWRGCIFVWSKGERIPDGNMFNPSIYYVMIRYKIYKNLQKKGLTAGKWFARAVSDETFDLDKLAEHMSKHQSPYSSGVIKGVLTDMVDCIKELLLDGKNVKIDDLAIFGVGIRSKAAETLEEFSLEKNITGMRLKARATGNLSTTQLKLESQLKQQGEYQKPTTSGSGGGGSDSGNTPTPNPDDGGGETPDPAA